MAGDRAQSIRRGAGALAKQFMEMGSDTLATAAPRVDPDVLSRFATCCRALGLSVHDRQRPADLAAARSGFAGLTRIANAQCDAWTGLAASGDVSSGVIEAIWQTSATAGVLQRQLGLTPGALGFAYAAAAVWNISPLAVGWGLILVALLITVQAAQLSSLCARLPVPVIPAPGDPTPSAPPLRVLEDLPRRIRAGDSHQTGFIAAGVLLAVIGSVAVLWPVVGGDGEVSPWAWYVVVAVALGAALRARVWDSAPCKAWLLGHSYLVTTVLLAMFAAAGDHAAAGWALAVLAALVAVWVVAALNPRIAEPDTYALPMRRLLGFVASAFDASLIPVMAYLVGIFAWVLNR